MLSSPKKKGSMTIEASLALPLFLFLMMTLLLTLETVRFQANVQEALHMTGNNISFQGYRGNRIVASDENPPDQIRTYLDRQLFPYLCVRGGAEGISLKTEKEEDGRLRISAKYQIRSFTELLPIGRIVIRDSFRGHQWIGYRGGGFADPPEHQEIYVYITETGTRYHLHADCTYLRIPVSAISSAELANRRNQSGGKYYPCERCGPGEGQNVFLTAEGASFHSHADCPSLKRTVYRVPISQAEGYGCCSKCAGR